MKCNEIETATTEIITIKRFVFIIYWLFSLCIFKNVNSFINYRVSVSV